MADVTINELTSAPSIVSSLLLPVTDGISTYRLSVANVNSLAPVQSVAGKTGIVTLTNADVGLGNVDNKSSVTIRGEITSTNVTTALGFTPVQQGGGSGQGTNKLYMGWSGSGLLLQIDATNFGNTWPISVSGNAANGAKAWVNFDGTRDTTGAISTANTSRLRRGSFNVDSVSRNGRGDYTVNFTAGTFANANYCIQVTAGNFNGRLACIYNTSSYDAQSSLTASSARVMFCQSTSTPDNQDINSYHVVVFSN
jgi:hypothetical protein